MLTCVLFVLLLCYAVDPLWCFTHANRLNSKQIRFNERQQKCDYLATRKNNYDILILGSSRTTFLAASDVGGKQAFNFAVNAMMPMEYKDYADFFKRHNRHAPDTIIIGLDFFATNGSFPGYDYLAPTEYFRNAENSFWKYSVLLSRDVLLYSLRNIRLSIKGTELDYYDRNCVKSAVYLPQAAKQHLIDKDVAMFKRDYYGKTYRYRNLKEEFRGLLKNNPESKFIIFTTPDSLPIWNLLLEEGRLEDYLRWIGDIVDVFGEVYDFMGENSFSSNAENYMDGHHFYPIAGKIIADRITRTDLKLPGILVTRDNYNSYAASIRAKYTDLNR